ncbi:TrbC/VirB2 family protein [Salmonella enterica]|uniref:TrbC/VirB2 family protein n=1 Tax=Salmonella enterica TaxID=28901 RepID=A0A743UFQ2_SALER|nr:TrbC/VirB2 family protein [Salmonella enterica]EFR8119565.1 TrbC/VirB2 family protein [Salmonella enterica]EGJ5379133.1 TrbC/VirB2 family protein [Salmonella enterica]EIE9851481.1 TrbC/VirB2 family protein [Salmonella enterica]EKA9468658.1 TrbC/VirB2 family protein [Salmonella enterica]
MPIDIEINEGKVEVYMVTFFKNNGFALLVALLCIAAPELALAAGGVDTGASTGNNIKSWLDTWIPIACTIGVIVSFLVWLFHLISAGFMFRLAIAMVGIGSASYLVSLTGIGS